MINSEQARIINLELKVNDLISERDSALAQNAELVAQVEALRKALNDQLNDCINFDGGKLTDVIMKHSSNALMSTAQQRLRDIQVEVVSTIKLDEYGAGHLNDFGGGNVSWWQDYIRAELGAAYEFYQSQIDNHGA